MNNQKKIFIAQIVMLILTIGMFTVNASNYLFASNEVAYDNSKSGIKAGNVQDAITELYACASNYREFKDITLNNPWFHNSVFRGKDVTSYYTDGTLYTRISDGTFDDLYVGDYINVNNVNWRIAGFDIYLGKGDTPLTTHHAVIVPDTNLTSAPMNSTNITTGGYVGSEMYTTTLPSVLTTYIEPVFGDAKYGSGNGHIVEYRNLLTTGTNGTLIGRYGSAGGGANNWAWQTRKLDLMNENQVYGSIVWSSTGYETGSDNIQFPLFRLKPEFVNKQRSWYWLRNVTSASLFAYVGNYGLSYHGLRFGLWRRPSQLLYRLIFNLTPLWGGLKKI